MEQPLGHQVVLDGGSQPGEPVLGLGGFQDPVETETRHHVLEHAPHPQGVAAVRRVQDEESGAVEGCHAGRRAFRPDVVPLAVEEAEVADRRARGPGPVRGPQGPVRQEDAELAVGGGLRPS